MYTNGVKDAKHFARFNETNYFVPSCRHPTYNDDYMPPNSLPTPSDQDAERNAT